MSTNSDSKQNCELLGDKLNCFIDSNIMTTETYSEKLKEINGIFRSAFGEVPDYYIRVPGRVNLIGEHIDYCGYPVCPMAIKQEIVVAVKSTKNNKDICIFNVNQEYTGHTTRIDEIKIDCNGTCGPFWADYFLCGVAGVLSGDKTITKETIHGMRVVVSGNIPPAAGLSSSSALVCAGALASNHAFECKYDKNSLAKLAAKCERFIGTEGGGMDQAIILCAEEGCASYIQFNPLTMKKVELPKNAKFVIAQSLVTKNKAASNDFNTRVVECRLASLVLAKKYLKDWEKLTVLAEVQNKINPVLKSFIDCVDKEFHEEPYTKEEICSILEVSSDKLEKEYLTSNTRQVSKFKLRQRALHVYNEALRVDSFAEICAKDKSVKTLGKLMTESHQSLRDLYECSHPELDRLVNVCLSSGAYGARLTGAGWGGCVVALIPNTDIDVFIASVKDNFYKDKVAPRDMNDLIIVSEPYPGASVYKCPKS